MEAKIITKVIKVNPRDIKRQEVNARFMTADEFQRLVANIKRDGCLTDGNLIPKSVLP